jgi:hypothetical protein
MMSWSDKDSEDENQYFWLVPSAPRRSESRAETEDHKVWSFYRASRKQYSCPMNETWPDV